jgi:hypothetical protein
VVIVGAAVAIVMEHCLVPFPTALAALTVKVDVPTAVGVPVISPVAARFKPSGNDVPLSMLHVTGLSPVASSVVWLYAVPTVPPGNDAVVIVGATPFLPPPVSLPSPQAPKENPIIATMVIIPNNLLLFFIKHTPFYEVILGFSVHWVILLISSESVKTDGETLIF